MYGAVASNANTVEKYTGHCVRLAYYYYYYYY